MKTTLNPTASTRAAPGVADTVVDSLARLSDLAATIDNSGDDFAIALHEAAATMQRCLEQVRRVHWMLGDKQWAILATARPEIENTMSRLASSGPRLEPGVLDAQRTAALREAESDSAKNAIAELGPAVLGGKNEDGTMMLGLAQEASNAGAELERRVTKAEIRWRNGIGRPKVLDDMAAKERLRAVLRSKPIDDVAAFVEATISDADDTEFATVDEVAREIAVDAIQQPTSKTAALRDRTSHGPATHVGQRILRTLDAETEKRTPASIVAAREALEICKGIYRQLVAPNATFMLPAEYQSFRSGGAAALDRLLRSWAVDDNWAQRFLAPRPYRLSGWSPIAGRDAKTGTLVRTPR